MTRKNHYNIEVFDAIGPGGGEHHAHTGKLLNDCSYTHDTKGNIFMSATMAETSIMIPVWPLHVRHADFRFLFMAQQ